MLHLARPTWRQEACCARPSPPGHIPAAPRSAASRGDSPPARAHPTRWRWMCNASEPTGPRAVLGAALGILRDPALVSHAGARSTLRRCWLPCSIRRDTMSPSFVDKRPLAASSSRLLALSCHWLDALRSRSSSRSCHPLPQVTNQHAPHTLKQHLRIGGQRRRTWRGKANPRLQARVAARPRRLPQPAYRIPGSAADDPCAF